MNYSKIVGEVVSSYKDSPIYMLGNEGNGEYKYLSILKDSYVRTIRDVDNLYLGNRKGTKILEISAFLGLFVFL